MNSRALYGQNSQGFTLIEVAVALAILGWVLGSAIFVVTQYGAERIKMRERYFANQVAWNQLLEQYQFAQGWQPDNYSEDVQENGFEHQGDQDWFWEMTVAPALGNNMFRYQVASALDEEQQSAATLSVFLVRRGAQ